MRNVTDIDDKIIAKSAEQGRPWWAIGYENERAFNAGYDALGCLPPTVRAAGHRARPRDDRDDARASSSAATRTPADGNVYFDVRSFPGYLSLSNQELDNLRQPEGEGETGKRDPRDFAMWKAAKPGRAELGDALGPRPPRLAPGVLGDGPQVPGRAPSTSTAAAST